MEGVTDLARKVPGVEWTIDNVISGLLVLMNEITHDWISTESIYNQFNSDGHIINSPGDVFKLDLEHVDNAARNLSQTYTTLAGLEGAATGFVGLPGIVPDIVGLTAINC